MIGSFARDYFQLDAKCPTLKPFRFVESLGYQGLGNRNVICKGNRESSPPMRQDTTTKPEAATTASQGPAAHEDLTIAEELETMRVQDESRPGEQCFLNENGEKRWVSESEVNRFLRRLGAMHPAVYLATHGFRWEQNLFSGF